MKNKFLKLLPFLLLFASLAYSQTFTFQRVSGAYIQLYPDSVYRDNISYATITVSSGSLNLRMIRTSQNLPAGWQSAMCDIHACYPPNVDTIPPTSYSSGVIDTVSVHFYDTLHTTGYGTITVRVENAANTSQYIVQTFGATSFPIGIKQLSTVVKEFSLSQNYPNPFNPSTKIDFTLPKTEVVFLRVYDILGREVKTLVNESLNAGEYQVDFDAKNLSSGMYYYSLRAGDNVSVKKMVLVK